MSEAIDFIQYRLAHVPYRRERWLAPRIGRINVLHNRRLEFEKLFVDHERGQKKRTYYKTVEPNCDCGKFCVHLNTMIDRLRETGQAAVVLDFALHKKMLGERENTCTKKPMIFHEVNSNG